MTVKTLIDLNETFLEWKFKNQYTYELKILLEKWIIRFINLLLKLWLNQFGIYLV